MFRGRDEAYISLRTAAKYGQLQVNLSLKVSGTCIPTGTALPPVVQHCQVRLHSILLSPRTGVNWSREIVACADDDSCRSTPQAQPQPLVGVQVKVAPRTYQRPNIRNAYHLAF